MRFPSLTLVGCIISERKLKEAKHWLKTVNVKCPLIYRVRYNSVLENQGPDKGAMKEKAYVFRRNFQLMLGHTVTGTYFCCIGKVESDRCWECSSQA